MEKVGMSVRWFAKGVVLAGVLIAAMSGSPAYAAVQRCDVKASAVTSTKGALGAIVHIQIRFQNLGPDPTLTGGIYWDYVAPPGAELLGTTATWQSYHPGLTFGGFCKWLTPKTHMRCYSQVEYGDLGGAPLPYDPVYLWLIITKTITGRGSYSVHCVTGSCTDPVPGNNSASLIINGVGLYKAPKPTPTHKPTPKPTPKPSAKPSISPTPSVAPVLTPSPVVTPDAPPTTITPSLPPVVLTVATASGTPLWVWVAVPIGVLVLAGGGLYLGLGRRPKAQL